MPTNAHLPDQLVRYLTQSHPPPSTTLDRKWLNMAYRALWKHRYRGSLRWKSEPHVNFIDSMRANAAFENRGTTCDAGIVVTTWNRPEYLQSCLQSLARSELSGTIIVLVDDASDDPETRKLLDDFDLDTPLVKIRKRERTLMHVGLDIGWCFLQNLGCRYLSNLDADAIVRRDWFIRLRQLFESLPYPGDDVLLSGFNRSNAPCIREEHENYLRKYRMGGINYFFTPAFYQKVRHLMFNSNWDSHIQYLCGTEQADAYYMICCKPSVVQHIGIKGLNSGTNSPFDTAEDFIPG